MPQSLVTALAAVPMMAWIFLASGLGALILGVIAHGRAAFTPGDRVLTSARVNIFLLVLNSQIMPFFVLLVGQSNALYAHFGAPSVAPESWSAAPPIVTVLVALLTWDFVNYWNHRFMHGRVFWGVHAVHHSDTDVNWTTTYRVHVFEIFFMRLAEMLVLGWLGFPEWALFIAGLINSMHNKYVHCHLGWDHGPFDRVIASPNLHRWHHADTPEAMGMNLANLFSAWDWMFGTYYNPGRCEARLGFEGSPDQDVVRNLLYPFAYWRELNQQRPTPAQA